MQYTTSLRDEPIMTDISAATLLTAAQDNLYEDLPELRDWTMSLIEISDTGVEWNKTCLLASVGLKEISRAEKKERPTRAGLEDTPQHDHLADKLMEYFGLALAARNSSVTDQTKAFTRVSTASGSVLPHRDDALTARIDRIAQQLQAKDPAQ